MIVQLFSKPNADYFSKTLANNIFVIYKRLLMTFEYSANAVKRSTVVHWEFFFIYCEPICHTICTTHVKTCKQTWLHIAHLHLYMCIYNNFILICLYWMKPKMNEMLKTKTVQSLFWYIHSIHFSFCYSQLQNRKNFLHEWFNLDFWLRCTCTYSHILIR